MRITFAEDLGLTCRLFIYYFGEKQWSGGHLPDRFRRPCIALLHNALRLIPRKYLLHIGVSVSIYPRAPWRKLFRERTLRNRSAHAPRATERRQAVFGQMIEDCFDAAATSEPTIFSLAPAVDVFLALSHSLRGCVYIDEIVIELWAPCYDALL